MTFRLQAVCRHRCSRLAGLALALATHGSGQHGRSFLGFDRFADWRLASDTATNVWTLTSGVVSPGMPWNELVLSWNVPAAAGIGWKFEARPLPAAPGQGFYVLGWWSSDPGSSHPRESVSGQKDEWAEVQTDTLVLRQPAEAVEVRVTCHGSTVGGRFALSFLGLSFLDNRVPPPLLEPNRAAWGRELPVPERSQAAYPEGISAWCSPTSLTMLLAYWAAQLERPELALEVPIVARNVHDPQWPGTGNWSFNMAYAGSFPGVRAYVTRLAAVSELEDWIAAGVPVAVSLSYNLLRGQPRDRSDGHLVVVRGFTEEGAVIVNDPGVGRGIRRVFTRANLIQAWAVSHHTVYLVFPQDRVTPLDRWGHW